MRDYNMHTEEHKTGKNACNTVEMHTNMVST